MINNTTLRAQAIDFLARQAKINAQFGPEADYYYEVVEDPVALQNAPPPMPQPTFVRPEKQPDETIEQFLERSNQLVSQYRTQMTDWLEAEAQRRKNIPRIVQITRWDQTQLGPAPSEDQIAGVIQTILNPFGPQYTAEQWIEQQGYGQTVRLIALTNYETQIRELQLSIPPKLAAIRQWLEQIFQLYAAQPQARPANQWPPAPYPFEEVVQEIVAILSNANQQT